MLDETAKDPTRNAFLRAESTTECGTAAPALTLTAASLQCQNH